MRRGTDGVLRLGEVAVQTPGGDPVVAVALAVCVIVLDERPGIYRTASTVTVTRAQAGSLEALQADRQRDGDASAWQVVGLTAWLIAASLGS